MTSSLTSRVLLILASAGCSASEAAPRKPGSNDAATHDANRSVDSGRDGGLSRKDAASPDGGDAGDGGDAALAIGNNMETLSVGGLSRSYIVHLPTAYTGQTPVPVVLDFHPLTVSAYFWSALTTWAATADAHGFIVVWPQGYMNSWDVGRCCDPAQDAGVDDVAFTRAILKALAGKANIDPTRVYATGCSNGGGMSYKLACEAADIIAAVAPVDFDCVTGTSNDASCGDCTPSRPISETQFRGTSDDYVPYDGGPTPVVAGLLFPGAQANFATWAGKDQCTGSPSPEPAETACDTYSTCAGDADVTLCTIPSGTHCGSYMLFPIVDIAWASFEAHSLP
jgi:polyhydroxybutyrate depolymerase